MRGIPKKYTNWIHLKVHNRKTCLHFDGFTSKMKTLLCGLDQGCPLSRILFQFYNAALLDIPNCKNGEEVTAYADDTIMLADGEDFLIANDKLSSMMSRSGGGTKWTISHYSHSVIDKSVLVGMT
ncbi:hypothetical protein K439DRAFT_1325050 [Ramaria rubella]|nr:hypothetical protein K439DRAFT_1325050 [Ramaria rubella]